MFLNPAVTFSVAAGLGKLPYIYTLGWFIAWLIDESVGDVEVKQL